MKKFRKLIPLTHKKETGSDVSDAKEFPNLLSPAEIGKVTKTVKPRATNHYTDWPIKLMGNPKIKKTQENNNSNLGESSSAASATYVTDLEIKKQKPLPSITLYKETLQQLIDLQLEQNITNFDSLHKNEASHQRFKKLMKIGQKLNLKKCDTDFLEWKAYVNAFFTRLECRLKILPTLAKSFGTIVKHIQHNFLELDNVQEFWKSIEHISEEIWSEIVGRSMDYLLTPSVEPTETEALLDVGLMFLGEIWNYFDTKNPVPLLDDEMDSIARIHMETIMTKLETELVRISKQAFSHDLSEISIPNLCSAIARSCEELKRNKSYWKDAFHGYKIKLDLYEIIYSVWDLEIYEAMLPILRVSKTNIVKIKFESKYPILSQNFDADRDISLFSLFLTLRKFSNLTDKTGLPNFVRVKSYLYSWFHEFVPQWIDVACYRAMTRIDKAVKKDNLDPITTSCKRSYSSTFTVDTFSAMEISWHELDWPNPEQAYSFAILTLKNFDRCIQFYAESICNRLEELDNENFYCFGGSDELFIAINNVEYVSKKVGTIAENLGVENLVKKLAMVVYGGNEIPNLRRFGSHTSIEQCMETPPNIIQNWKDNVHRRVSDCLILTYDKTIEPLLNMFLETAASSAENERDSDKVIIHLNGILERMTAKLNSTEYARAFPTVADRILESYLDFAKRSIQGTKSSQFFQHLEDMLVKLCALFRKSGIGELISKKENEISNLAECLRLYKISTDKLITEYLNKRYEDQSASDRHSQEGFLTVLGNYNEENRILHLNILNGSLLKAGDVNSYVRFKIYSKRPSGISNGKINYCSKVQKHTKYPLYQETFNIEIPKSELDSGGFIHFWVKSGHFYKWKFVGESFLPFEKISRRSDEVNDPVQNKLPITLPTPTNTQILDILDDRKDVSGFKFSTTQRQRISLNK